MATADTNPDAQGQAVEQAFDPNALPPGYYDNPYPTYHALRRHDPVHRCPDGTYFLTRHADLCRVYRNARLFCSDKQQEFKQKFGDSLLYEHHTTSLVFNDPPLHTRVRKAFGDALSMRTVAAMEGRLRQLVEGLLDRLEGRIAIGRLFERFPSVAFAAPPVRAQRARFRGFVAAPMRVGG